MVELKKFIPFSNSLLNPTTNGDLHTEVLPVSTGDELEIMTQTLDATLESLNRYISDIQRVLDRKSVV